MARFDPEVARGLLGHDVLLRFRGGEVVRGRLFLVSGSDITYTVSETNMPDRYESGIDQDNGKVLAGRAVPCVAEWEYVEEIEDLE